MASTILYKFKAGINFESLPLPGTSARLFDIKRAIVRAKKLDRSATGSGLEFDLAIENATTNEVYDDESMILPRGTRIIVRRVAAEKHQGLLSRIARAEVSGGVPPPMMGAGGATTAGGVQDGYYTFRSRDRDGDDEFLDQEPAPQAAVLVVDESKELEALKAVTDQASMYGSAGMARGPNPIAKGWGGGPGGAQIAGSGPPRVGGAPHFPKPPPRSRPNADPELREQELRQQSMPKKRATGIPRTFLSLNAPAQPDGDLQNENAENSGEGGLASRLQPNTIGFEALVNRAGGQSIDAAGKRRDLDYALKLTATSIPDHLQCGICHSVVKNAMLVPWDDKGRPCCESCIRDSLTQNGFKCPLTGTEGVSPDELFPNHGLRKVADLFVQEVMEKMDQIERQVEAEAAEEAKRNSVADKKASEVYEGEGGERGVLLTRKAQKQPGKKQDLDDDIFGGEDEFGGDVFDVASDENEADEAAEEPELSNDKPVFDASKPNGNAVDSTPANDNNSKSESKDENGASNTESNNGSSGTPNDLNNNVSPNNNVSSQNDPTTNHQQPNNSSPNDNQNGSQNQTPSDDNNVVVNSSSRPKNFRREQPKRRGPPAGYVLGPAGGGAVMASSSPTKVPMAVNPMGGYVPGSVPPPPPPPPPPPIGGRGGNPIPMGGGMPHNNNMGRGPGGGGGRFSQNQFGSSNHYQGGRGGRVNNMMYSDPQLQQQQYPDQRQHQNYGGGFNAGRGRHANQGRGGFNSRMHDQQGGQHWGDNRKRPRDTMEGGTMHQDLNQQGWGGSGDFNHRGPPQYAGGRGRFDGRGGGGFNGGRGGRGGFRGGRGGGRSYGRGRF